MWGIKTSNSADSRYPMGDVRRCLAASSNVQPLYRMEVLPGGGFDNLCNLDMGQVHAHTYKDCQAAGNGKYLLPDNVFLTPRQESNVNIYSEFFDHWDNYTGTGSASINSEASFLSLINGKFSFEFTTTKTRQYNDNAKTMRTQMRYDLYTLAIQPGAELHPKLRQALMDIGANIQNNNTEYASYLAELLVRDYGTHYVTSINAGAVISKIDQINSTMLGDQFKINSRILASAGASFNQYLSISLRAEAGVSVEFLNNYKRQITHSKVISHGGPPFQPHNFSLKDWVEGIPDTLAATDRSGKPLHFAINTNTLPHLPEITVFQVSRVVEEAINNYYQANGRLGCTDPKSKNFDFQANMDDDSCNVPAKTFSFGGVYQTCVATAVHTDNLCSYSEEPKQQKNPLTGNYSCPPKYTPIKFHHGVLSKPTTVQKCKEVCGFLCWSQYIECRTQYQLDQAEFNTYWCAALDESAVPENSGYLFGGFYTPTTNNPLTGTKACPRYFQKLRIMRDVKVCVSSDFELGRENSVKFGGFFTCRVGNPLALSAISTDTSWPHSCPQGSTQHLVTIDQNCEISFCVEAGSFTSRSLIPVKLPPFMPRPDFKANTTDTLVVGGLHGTVWSKDSITGQWYEKEDLVDRGEALFTEEVREVTEEVTEVTEKVTEVAEQAVTEKATTKEASNSSRELVAVIPLSVVSSVLLTLLVGVAVSMVIYKCCKRKPSAEEAIPAGQGPASRQLLANYNVVYDTD